MNHLSLGIVDQAPPLSATQKTTQWPAPAKLNLFLYITGRQATGYHTLQTLFQFITLEDTLWITPRFDGQINVDSNLPTIQRKDNLIVKAAHLLQEASSTSQGASITIKKRIPLGSGLGGGSSNAATTLAALNQIWRCHYSREQLQQLGVSLGADVPIFLYGQAAFAEGIGEKLQKASPTERWYLVAYPDAGAISTAAIFNDPQLQRSTPWRTRQACLSEKPYHNDCESVVKKRSPAVAAALEWLIKYQKSIGSEPSARLTGTGAAIFAEFANQQAAETAQYQAPTGVTTFVVCGINRSPLLLTLERYRSLSPSPTHYP